MVRLEGSEAFLSGLEAAGFVPLGPDEDGEVDAARFAGREGGRNRSWPSTEPSGDGPVLGATYPEAC